MIIIKGSIFQEQILTGNMEVQKHPHHVTHKKKVGKYLLEFFMLFLAVFLRFVAENIRETSAEHEREKQYAQELYTEFYSDSIVFTNKIHARLGKEKDCDYLYDYIGDNISLQADLHLPKIPA